MNEPIREYWLALQRLIDGKPINIESGGRITNDSVALEAGRNRGSIKQSRPQHAELIKAIKEAQADRAKPQTDAKQKVKNQRDRAEKYRQLYEEAVARELSLLREVHELKQELAALKSGKVSWIGS